MLCLCSRQHVMWKTSMFTKRHVAGLELVLMLCSCRCSPTWRVHPSTTSSRPKGSRWDSTCPQPWGVKAGASVPASPPIMACHPGLAVVPPTVPRLYWPSAPTVRRRSVCLLTSDPLWFVSFSNLNCGLPVTDGWCDWWHYKLGVELQWRRSRTYGPRNPN